MTKGLLNGLRIGSQIGALSFGSRLAIRYKLDPDEVFKLFQTQDPSRLLGICSPAARAAADYVRAVLAHLEKNPTTCSGRSARCSSRACSRPRVPATSAGRAATSGARSHVPSARRAGDRTALAQPEAARGGEPELAAAVRPCGFGPVGRELVGDASVRVGPRQRSGPARQFERVADAGAVGLVHAAADLARRSRRR